MARGQSHFIDARWVVSYHYMTPAIRMFFDLFDYLRYLVRMCSIRVQDS